MMTNPIDDRGKNASIVTRAGVNGNYIQGNTTSFDNNSGAAFGAAISLVG